MESLPEGVGRLGVAIVVGVREAVRLGLLRVRGAREEPLDLPLMIRPAGFAVLLPGGDRVRIDGEVPGGEPLREASVGPEKPEPLAARPGVLHRAVPKEFHDARVVADERFGATLLPEEERPNVDL